MSATAITTGHGGRDASSIRRGLLLALAALPLGLLAGALAASGRGPAIFGLGIVAVFVLLWKKPQLSPAVLLAAMLTIEQFPTDDGPPSGVFTDKIPLFHGLSQSVHVNLADLLVLALAVLCLLKRGTGVTAGPPRSAVSFSLLALFVAVLLGLAVGQMHHGSLRTAFTEVRPYFYLPAAYVLATSFATTKDALRAVYWAIVLGTGFKAAETLFYFFRVHHEQPRPQAIVGHEEALFFGIFVLLTLSLWLFGVAGRLRTTATWLLPLVILADLANGRRTGWLILGACLVELLVIGLTLLPERRRVLTRCFCLFAVVSAVYFPAYWNHTGSLALPARTIRSAIHPDPRDSASDLYREQENANLELNIREGGVVGRGFGVPIDYKLPIVDLTSIDPLIAYVPHDGVLYILMRMGLLGGVAFWSLLGTAMIGAGRLARARDREIACFGAVLLCAAVGYALEGYNDQGFFFYRIAFVMGILFGIGEAARRLGSLPVPAVAASGAPPLPSALSPRPPRREVPSPPRPLRGRPAAPRARRRRVLRLVALPVAAAGVAGGVILGMAAHATPARGTSKAVPHRRAVGSSLPVRSLPHRSLAIGGPPPQRAALAVADVGNVTWVQVRAGSETGRILFSQQLQPGQVVHFHGSALWARFGGAGNVQVRANGRPRVLLGTTNILVRPGSVRVVAS